MNAGHNYIAGRWQASRSGATYENVGPMRPAEVLGTFADSAQEDAAAAVDAAARAFPAWAALPAATRGGFLASAAARLAERVEAVARDMTEEMGKPLREARGEVARAVQILEFFASEAYRPVGELFEQAAGGGQVSTRRRPVGVAALITPWNFPCAIPTWKLAPALIYGNTVVLKPALESPATALHVAHAFDDAGLPDGVLNVVTGRGAAAGAALVRDARVGAISFTGSVENGTRVRDEATSLGRRVQLELGGQNPLIVMADADLKRAAEAAYAGAYFAAGQKCTATRRIYVQAEAYDAFRALLLGRMASGRVGDPMDPSVEVGPIVNETQLTSVLAAIERGKAEGATVLAGGHRLESEGLLVAPTLFEGVRDDAFLSCEEVFGPVASLYRFESLDEALARANAVRFGLSAAIFTTNLATASRFQAEAQAGLLHVNSQTAGADVHVPFGGIKESGFGPHEQGRAALEFYTDLVTTYVDP